MECPKSLHQQSIHGLEALLRPILPCQQHLYSVFVEISDYTHENTVPVLEKGQVKCLLLDRSGIEEMPLY